MRRAIAELDALTPTERKTRLAWIATAIERQSNGHLKWWLHEALERKLAETARHEDQGQEAEGPAVVPIRGERESLEAMLKQSQEPVLSEKELRKQIEAMTLDPEHPEIGLTNAMELGAAIERIQDPELQERMRTLWEDRVFALQGITR